MKRLLTTMAMTLALTTPALAQDAPVVADNPEMTAIFAADQAIRQNAIAAISGDMAQARAFAERMIAEDAVRREQVRALLEANALKTAEDFRGAAFVFQHGSTADDFLMAHTLAVAAIAKGSTKASWIASASLDRYLHKIGQPQIYGTQSIARRGESPTRDPYNHTLVPDSLLNTLGVSTGPAEQARQAALGESEAPPPTP